MGLIAGSQAVLLDDIEDRPAFGNPTKDTRQPQPKLSTNP
jgi:hypothetical protein